MTIFNIAPTSLSRKLRGNTILSIKSPDRSLIKQSPDRSINQTTQLPFEVLEQGIRVHEQVDILCSFVDEQGVVLIEHAV